MPIIDSKTDLIAVRLLVAEARNLGKEISDFINNFDKFTSQKSSEEYIYYILNFLNHYKDIYNRVRKILPEVENALMNPDSYDFKEDFIGSITKIVTDSRILSQPSKGEVIAKLKSIAAASSALAEALEIFTKSNTSSEDYDRLVSLREQVERLSDFNLNLYKHLVKAIEEYENGHYLASALISGKVVQYIYDKLRSMFNTLEEGESSKRSKIESVASQIVKLLGIKERYSKELIETTKLARNYFTHDINAIPEPHEALRLLSGACDLALKYQAILMKK